MRLSEVLSSPQTNDFVQVDSFLDKKLSTGKQKCVDVGRIRSTYFCNHCNNLMTFATRENGKLYCIGVSDTQISIDCVLECTICKTPVKKWFLIESKDKIYYSAPEVRILKQSEYLSDDVMLENRCPVSFGILLDKAQHAYYEKLGAGAAIYLRKIFEQITVKSANANSIDTKKPNGLRKNFSDLLKEVDQTVHIIPAEFSANGYRLFGELSNILHNDYDECIALEKYKDLRRLVCGILDNIRNNEEMLVALERLGWNEEDNNVQN